LVPARAVDGRAGPPLPRIYRERAEPPPIRREKKSPLPDDWSERTQALRELVREIEDMIEDSGR
jgi:hypothetical protein